MKQLRKGFLTFFYTGLSPYAPGTVGTIAALIAGLFILQYLPASTLFWLTVLVTIIGVKQTDIYIQYTDSNDPKEVVIDEVVGMWLALSMITLEPLNIALAFIFFRAYDILKPSIIGRIDRSEKGGMAVMGDDVVAGFFAAITAEAAVIGITYIKGLL